MTYKMQAALATVRQHGFKVAGFSSSAADYLNDNRLVTLHQTWTSGGTEAAEFRLARGQYKGVVIGCMYREQPKWK